MPSLPTVVQAFFDSVPNETIFNDEQDIEFATNRKPLTLKEFMHAEFDPERVQLPNEITVPIHHIATLYPATDSTLHVGVQNEQLVAFSIDTWIFYVSEGKPQELATAINDGMGNMEIFKLFFRDRLVREYPIREEEE